MRKPSLSPAVRRRATPVIPKPFILKTTPGSCSPGTTPPTSTVPAPNSASGEPPFRRERLAFSFRGYGRPSASVAEKPKQSGSPTLQRHIAGRGPQRFSECFRHALPLFQRPPTSRSRFMLFWFFPSVNGSGKILVSVHFRFSWRSERIPDA